MHLRRTRRCHTQGLRLFRRRRRRPKSIISSCRKQLSRPADIGARWPITAAEPVLCGILLTQSGLLLQFALLDKVI